jgi:small subunit ribosomal protein S2
MINVTMKQLLEAGVHFGHQSRRWNPKMAKYIYTERNGIYIIDLKKTLRCLREAYKFVRDSVALGQTVLFVGTKKQARDTIYESAKECNMFYVNTRWLGGMLTNFRTIRESVLRLIEIEKMEEDGSISNYTKKEISRLMKERTSLEKNLSGVKNMDKLPGLLFIVDPHKEQIAVREARKLKIPIVAIVDTNCDPDQIDHVIPGNDDAIRAIKLVCGQIVQAVTEGLMAKVETEVPAPSEIAIAAETEEPDLEEKYTNLVTETEVEVPIAQRRPPRSPVIESHEDADSKEA